jgi:hypothetical protein
MHKHCLYYPGGHQFEQLFFPVNFLVNTGKLAAGL